MCYILNRIYYILNNSFTSYNIKMDKQKLEAEKIALTKQYEKLLVEANRYWQDEKLIEKFEKTKNRINEIKKILDNN